MPKRRSAANVPSNVWLVTLSSFKCPNSATSWPSLPDTPSSYAPAGLSTILDAIALFDRLAGYPDQETARTQPRTQCDEVVKQAWNHEIAAPQHAAVAGVRNRRRIGDG